MKAAESPIAVVEGEDSLKDTLAWPVRRRKPSHRRRRRVQGLVPGNLHPTRIRLALRPGAAQGPGKPLLAVDQFRRGPTLGAKRMASRMCGIGIEPRETPVFHAGDAAAAGDAQAAKTRDPSSRCCAHGLLLRPGTSPALRARCRRRHSFYTTFRRELRDRFSFAGVEQDSSCRTEAVLQCPLFVALIDQRTTAHPGRRRMSAIAAARTESGCLASRPSRGFAEAATSARSGRRPRL